MLPLRYGNLQVRGRQCQQWIADPSITGCPVAPSILTLVNVPLTQAEAEKTFQPEGTELKFQQLGVPMVDEEDWVSINLVRIDYSARVTAARFRNAFEGQAGPSALLVEVIKRKDGPYMSQVAQAFYQAHFPIGSMKHVFVFDIQNRDTKKFVTGDLYEEGLGVEWKYEDGTTPRTWYHDTSEYQALLGTPIGDFVAALVPGVYARGTRVISAITTNHYANQVQMRFDIQDVDPAKGTAGGKGQGAGARQTVSSIGDNRVSTRNRRKDRTTDSDRDIDNDIDRDRQSQMRSNSDAKHRHKDETWKPFSCHECATRIFNIGYNGRMKSRIASGTMQGP